MTQVDTLTNEAILLDIIFLHRTALVRAATNGHAEVCQFLVESGANPDAVDLAGIAALHLCAYGGKTDVCKVLIQGGADINVVDGVGK